MKTNTRQKIYEYIWYDKPTTVKEIVEFFWISKEMIHRHLKNLIQENKIEKLGNPPKVYYFWINQKQDFIDEKFIGDTGNLYENNKIIWNNFVYFWADGTLDFWVSWFKKWCGKRNLDSEKESITYIKTLEKYHNYKDENSLIDWIVKMKNTFDEVFLDEIYYLDFYSIEKYWKTLLGNLMLYAKQTWKKDLANKIINIIEETILNLINIKDINSFAFIPPSIDRKVQLMDLLKKGLNLNLKELKPVKIYKDTPVPQKSLNKKEDRILNARNTIYILDRDFRTDTILIIDDAVWSWATLNETAKKIKEMWLAKKVIWLAIVWSYKWFEVINEV